jgi:hypothetical protein
LVAKFLSNQKFQDISVIFLRFQLIEILRILVQIPFRIWRNFYKKRCSLSQALSIHILLPIFQVREGTFWIGQSLGQI